MTRVEPDHRPQLRPIFQFPWQDSLHGSLRMLGYKGSQLSERMNAEDFTITGLLSGLGGNKIYDKESRKTGFDLNSFDPSQPFLVFAEDGADDSGITRHVYMVGPDRRVHDPHFPWTRSKAVFQQDLRAGNVDEVWQVPFAPEA